MPASPQSSPFGSVTILVVAGFTATALPLIVALVVGSIRVNQLSQQSEGTIRASVQITRATETISDELVSMERNARQYVVLEDASLLELYNERLDRIYVALDQLQAADPTNPFETRLTDFRTQAREITEAINERPRNAARVDAAFSTFSQMHRLSAGLKDESALITDRELTALARRSDKMQETFIWQSIVLGLFGAVVATLFTRAILRPIKQINAEISRLGDENFDNSVKVDGPRDLRQIGERLDWLRQRLQDVENQKRTFVRHMSHELKTPLSNIRESTSLLLDEAVGPLAEKQREVLAILDASGRRLHRLVDNLINFARWQERHAKSASVFDITKLIRSQIGDHRLLLERYSVKVNAELPNTLQVCADQERVTTLFANLLSNAIKYSPPNEEVKLVVTSAGRDLIIEIEDKGIGIKEEERERIFEPFFQGEGSKSKVEGTGIGLSLVRECLESHDGHGEFLPAEIGAHFRARMPIVVGNKNVA